MVLFSFFAAAADKWSYCTLKLVDVVEIGEGN